MMMPLLMARLAPLLREKNKREKKEIKRPACQSGAKSVSRTVRWKGFWWFPVGNQV